MRSRDLVAVGLFLGAAATGVAYADEQLTPLAQSGAWIAMAHQTSLTASADMCLVMTPVTSSLSVGFRSDGSEVELRVINDAWSLPSSVSGNIAVTVGQTSKTFAIQDNTNNMVTTALSLADANELFDAMDKAPFMSVVAGNSKPVRVSLAGSTKATNAFRTCAHLKGAASGSGENPFQ